MNGYITIKEASQLTGKHADTIRRLIKVNSHSKNVAKDRKGRIIINSEWIISCFEPTEPPVSQSNVVDDNQPLQANLNGLEPVINALTNQLQAKDQQIANLQALLSDKENNTTKLQDQFQQLLARQQLTAGVSDSPEPAYEKPMQTEVEVAQEPASNPAPVKKTKAKKSTKKTTKKKPVVVVENVEPAKKKRWWSK